MLSRSSYLISRMGEALAVAIGATQALGRASESASKSFGNFYAVAIRCDVESFFFGKTKATFNNSNGKGNVAKSKRLANKRRNIAKMKRSGHKQGGGKRNECGRRY